MVTSAGTEKVEEEQRKRFGTTPGEGDGRNIEFICLLSKPNHSPQAGPPREQYKTPAAQIKRWGGGAFLLKTGCESGRTWRLGSQFAVCPSAVNEAICMCVEYSPWHRRWRVSARG